MNRKMIRIARRAALLGAFALASLSLNGCLLTQLLGGAGGAGGLLGGAQPAGQPAGKTPPPTATAPLGGSLAAGLPGAPGTTAGATTNPTPTAATGSGAPAPQITAANQQRINDLDGQIAAKRADIQHQNDLIAGYMGVVNEIDTNSAGRTMTPNEKSVRADNANNAQNAQNVITQRNQEIATLQSQRDRLASGQAA